MKKSKWLVILSLLILTAVSFLSFEQPAHAQTIEQIPVQQMLTGNKMSSKNVNVFIQADTPAGIKADAIQAVKKWDVSTDKLAFKITQDRNKANIVFYSGQISNFLNARTFFDQMQGKQVKVALIKMNREMIDNSQLTNFGTLVAEHEIGHTLGLADVKNPQFKSSTIMWYRDPVTDITKNDTSAINYLYQ